jgi:ATP-dependent Clp protease ATP-binding subunit ClpA
MFEGFTKEARAIVERARAEALALGHDRIGTEHLALGAAGAAGLDPGVLRGEVARGDLDGDALATVGIDLDAVRERVESAFGAGALHAPASAPRRTPFTRPAKRALQEALRQAVADGAGELRAEHLLLGVLAEPDGRGARLLAGHGVTTEALRVR